LKEKEETAVQKRKLEKQLQREEKLRQLEAEKQKKPETKFKKHIHELCNLNLPRELTKDMARLNEPIGYKDYTRYSAGLEWRVGKVYVPTGENSLQYKSIWMDMIKRLLFCKTLELSGDPGYYSHFKIYAEPLESKLIDSLVIPAQEVDILESMNSIYSRCLEDINIEERIVKGLHCGGDSLLGVPGKQTELIDFDLEAEKIYKNESYDDSLSSEDVLSSDFPEPSQTLPAVQIQMFANYKRK